MVRFDPLKQRAREVVGPTVKREVVSTVRDLPVHRHQVLYESFGGNGMLDHPEAIFRALLADPELGHLRHVWVLSNSAAHAEVVAEFVDDDRVRFVRPGTVAYADALARSAYLVNNATFPQSFAKRPGQVYLNTWHGTPLKTMGCDMPDGAVQSRNVVRNFLAADYLLTPNAAVEDMYLRAYRLRNLFAGKLLCAGSPRIDAQFAPPDAQERTRARLHDAGVALDPGRRVVLYAPTWKGQFSAPANDITRLRTLVRELGQRLDPADQVLLKVHQRVYRFANEDPELRGALVPNDVPTNQVLALTDVLITDYSSVFVDFLATGRPVLFYAPDLEHYEAERGWYLPLEQWPGPICRDVDELADQARRAGSGHADDPAVVHAETYRQARERYCASEDGQATQRVVDVVFRGREHPEFVRQPERDGRTTILIYVGGVRPNGITASARSLLDAIDHDRFDVSLYYTYSERPSHLELVASFNERARLLPTDGDMIGHHLGMLMLKRRHGRLPGASHLRDLDRAQHLLRTEWVRSFGDATFDHVVDFSGYSPFWTKVLLAGGSPSLSIWLHNDLAADAQRKVDGRYPHRANLEAIFELYRNADHLVSVSPSLAVVNAEKLAAYADPGKFTSARNAIDFERVRRLAFGDSAPAGARAVGGVPASAGLIPQVDRLIAEHGPARVRAELERYTLVDEFLPPRARTRTFVTIGRLSPEKNHARMVKAFARVHRDDPDTRLLIIGSGPLRSRLSQLIDEQGLTDVVELAGHQPNPYPLVAASDCFVLSSDYEGQPMVILEALVLGVPVLSTAFDSVADALPAGHGLVVERSEAALAEGMRTFLRGGIPAVEFDAATYNKQAAAEFERAIGA